MTDEILKPEEKTERERKASLPAFLRRSLESAPKRQEMADNQKLWASKSQSPYLHVTPQESQMNIARRQLPEWMDAYTQVESELQSAIEQKQPAERIIFLTERHRHFAQVLAETLATLGHFQEAAEIHPVEAQRADYERIQAAIERHDEEECDEDCEAVFADDPGLVSRYRVEREVWSHRHGRMMSMVTCNVCHKANVRPEPVALKQERLARRRAEGLTKGLSPERAAQVLREANLTPDKVFK